MRRSVYLAIAVLAVVSLLVGCSPATPTVAPTKPPAAPAAATTAPATVPSTPTAAPKAAATSAPAPTPTAAPKIKRGGTLVMSAEDQSNSLDPIFDTRGWHTYVLALYEGLVDYELVDNATGQHEIKPWLAESWQQVDPKTIVFKLQKGVKFHDGSEFNAEAAKWSLERMANNPKSLSKSFAGNIASLEVVDAYTLRINYKNASALQLIDLSMSTTGTGSIGSGIVSKAQIDKVGEEAFGTQPSGTGPMKFADWKRDDVYSVTKWEGYWKKGVDGQPLPYLDGIQVRRIPDAAVQLLELKAGTVQAARNILPTDLDAVKANPDLNAQVMSWGGARWYFGFNPARSPFGTNVKLRQAANYAVDRASMAKVMSGDSGAPLYYVTWAPGILGYDDKLPRYDFDLAKATQLVKDAGFPNGVDIEYMHSTGTMFRKASEVVQAMWAKAGIRAKLEAVDKNTAQERTKNGEFDLYAASVSWSPDPVYFDRKYLCNASANWNNYCNPELDKCLAEGGKTADPKQRQEIYGRCQKIIYEDALLNGLFLDGPAIVTRKEVKGLKVNGLWEHTYEVWLDK